MNELALFAGAGGGILGGHLLGWRTVCAAATGNGQVPAVAAAAFKILTRLNTNNVNYTTSIA